MGLRTIVASTAQSFLPPCVKRDTVVQSSCDSVVPGQGDREGVPPRVQPKVSAYCPGGEKEARPHSCGAALSDLRGVPGNRLEALTGDRKGQYSIRINDRWRICFRWADTDALEVEIVDYH
jgi:proteic killer suppression protein